MLKMKVVTVVEEILGWELDSRCIKMGIASSWDVSNIRVMRGISFSPCVMPWIELPSISLSLPQFFLGNLRNCYGIKFQRKNKILFLIENQHWSKKFCFLFSDEKVILSYSVIFSKYKEQQLYYENKNTEKVLLLSGFL